MSGRPGRPCDECGSDSLHTHIPPTPGPAEDRDSRLRELATTAAEALIPNDDYPERGELFTSIQEWDQMRALAREQHVARLVPLLSAFADEVRGEAEEELSIWKARAEDAEKESRLHEWEQLALRKANEADAAERGKREAVERARKAEETLQKVSLYTPNARADTAEAEVARLREERDNRVDELVYAQRQVEELRGERDEAHEQWDEERMLRIAADARVSDLERDLDALRRGEDCGNPPTQPCKVDDDQPCWLHTVLSVQRERDGLKERVEALTELAQRLLTALEVEHHNPCPELEPCDFRELLMEAATTLAALQGTEPPYLLPAGQLPTVERVVAEANAKLVAQRAAQGTDPRPQRACIHCNRTAEELGPIGMWQHCPEHEGGSLQHDIQGTEPKTEPVSPDKASQSG